MKGFSHFYYQIFIFENIIMSMMKHLPQIFEGGHPLALNLALGPNSQAGWRHAGAVDWSKHTKYRTEDGVNHLEERGWPSQLSLSV